MTAALPIRPWSAPTSPAAEALAASLRGLVPRIDTVSLTLRAPQRKDFAAWAAIFCSDRAVHMDGPCSEDEAWFDFSLNCASWMLRGHGMWTVTGKAGEVLGFVLIGMEPGDQEPELGYMFVESAEGQGHATEAAAAARDFALTRLQLPSLVSYIAPDNARSRAVARRLGAFPDGEIDGCEIWRHAPKGQR
jgi:RimJ/RimL family protein N-acetyltransferase